MIDMSGRYCRPTRKHCRELENETGILLVSAVAAFETPGYFEIQHQAVLSNVRYDTIL